MPSTGAKALLRVAVGVVCDAEQRILIARRAEHRHQGGLWEFPGGKIEGGETLVQALSRELHEELGIDVLPDACEPLLTVEHDYGDKAVRLEVCRVRAFTGVATGKEGQPLRWVAAAELDDYAFPAANAAIVKAVQGA